MYPIATSLIALEPKQVSYFSHSFNLSSIFVMQGLLYTSYSAQRSRLVHR